jgi:hypothetical protein
MRTYSMAVAPETSDAKTWMRDIGNSPSWMTRICLGDLNKSLIGDTLEVTDT